MSEPMEKPMLQAEDVIAAAKILQRVKRQAIPLAEWLKPAPQWWRKLFEPNNGDATP